MDKTVVLVAAVREAQTKVLETRQALHQVKVAAEAQGKLVALLVGILAAEAVVLEQQEELQLLALVELAATEQLQV